MNKIRHFIRTRTKSLFVLLTKCHIVKICCVLVFLYVIININGAQNKSRPQKTEKSKDEEDSEVNETWVEVRKKLLVTNRISKVFLFTYMRGGSTLFGQMFDLDPLNSVMFFEPLDAFYQSYAGLDPHTIPLSLLYDGLDKPRSLSEMENEALTDYFDSLFNCQTEKLPLETFAHLYLAQSSSFRQTYNCMALKNSKIQIRQCLDPIRDICGNYNVIRRNMSIAIANRCPEIIRALKLVMPNYTMPDPPPSGGTKRTEPAVVDYKAIQTKLSAVIEGGLKPNDIKRIPSFVNYHICMSKLKVIFQNCMDPLIPLKSKCTGASLVTLKVIRAKMKDLEAIIQQIPDLYMVYYTRDPRAVATSRLQLFTPLTYSNADRSVVTEAKILCHKMWEDIQAQKQLERKYPELLTSIRYEDFVRDINGTALQLFNKIGYSPPPLFYHWAKSKTAGASASDGPYGTNRSNVTAAITNWRSNVTFKDALEMNHHCRKVLDELNYPLY